MKQKDFEQAVLELAMTTRVPLTQANILFYTGVPSKQAGKWLDAMVGESLLDFDSDDEGNILYTLRGSRRPTTGPTELRRCVACGKATLVGARCTRCGQSQDARLQKLRSEVDERRSAALRATEQATTALTLLRRQSDLLGPAREGDKSLLVAGLLGLVGPIGWLYAAPIREAGPAAAVCLLLWALMPAVILVPMLAVLLPILMPTSALVGALYAWKHNRAGRRSGLLTEDDPAGPGRA